MTQYTTSDTDNRARGDWASDQEGAVLPIVALLIVVLLVFAAFTVDLGAAWAERRQLQSAADAGAMAGAFPPVVVGDDIATTAMDFVDRNVGIAVDRFGCTGWDPTVDGGVSETFGLVDAATTNCVWISAADLEDGGRLIAVKVPTQQVPTSFARVIGVNSIAVDAFAVSKVQVGNAHTLPFLLLSGPSAEECLGSPPVGIADSPCTGPATGNFGYLTSPDYGPDGACDAGILEDNIAVGIDHPLSTDIKWEGDNAGADTDLPDVCTTPSKEQPPYIVDSLSFLTGNHEAELHDGLASNNPFTDPFTGLSTKSRLQQGPGNPLHPDTVEDTRTVGGKNPAGKDDLLLDNVGLWEYVASGSNKCEPGTSWTDQWSTGGPEATSQMKTCLLSALSGGSTVTFDSSLWETSPRFAIIPEVWSSTVPTGVSDYRAIHQFRAVYIQTTWFNCSAADFSTKLNDKAACVQFEDLKGDMHEIFRPGEGDDLDSVACDVIGAGVGEKCKKAEVGGMSAFVLPSTSIDESLLDNTPVRYLFR